DAALAAARDRAADLAPELARLRRRPASGSSPASMALAVPDDHIVLQRIGLGGRPRGFLAVGTHAPLPHVAHTIVGAAVALLTLQSETPRTGRAALAALAALLAGRPATGPAVPDGPVRVMAGAGGAGLLDPLESDPAGERCLAAPLAGGTAVIVPDDLAGQVTALLAATGPIGVSDPAAIDDGRAGALAGALRQAEDALAAARRAGRPVLHHADLPGQGVLGLLEPAAAHAFAAALLAPLRAEGLVGTVRAYVAANGQGEAAARALGVHRHTLRSRMRKAAELLDRDLDDPAVRAELWIALAVTDNEDGPIGQPGDSPSGAPEIA
ncbi:helix-turn-helix domain-containing protein, partial [Actinomadura napierensis]|uniref:helix-turn-helix domain-containing protein n=1 Tax=Actinomadura napierensis TaxID=267854 RepID=UPI0031CF0ADB